MFELRLDSDFSLIGSFETKEEAIQVMNAKIDDVLIDDSILMFDVTKLVFSRNGKKTIDKAVIMNDIKTSYEKLDLENRFLLLDYILNDLCGYSDSLEFELELDNVKDELSNLTLKTIKTF